MPRPSLLQGCLAPLLLFATPAALAATFLVTKGSDSADGVCDADCSLREAIQTANANPGSDEIRLQRAYYRLSLDSGGLDEDGAASGDLDITDSLVLRGLPDRSVIDADGLDRVIEVLPGVSVELRDLTLREGRVPEQGGGIFNAGDLTLRRVWVLGNRVDAGPVLQGGGIYNAGQLRIIDGKIDRNQALEGRVALLGGEGAGLYNAAGATVYLYDSTVRDNQSGLDDAHGIGGGLHNRGQVRIDRSFFGRNDAGDGEGSAIYNGEGGSLTLINSTLSGNGHDGSSAAITNGNERGEAGRVTLIHTTIAYNNGGGLFNAGQAYLRFSLIAGNYTQDGNDQWFNSGRNCYTQVGGRTSQTVSLLGADGNCTATIMVDNGHVFSTVLEPLKYLGGPTPVHPLRPGPYAIDAATGDGCAPVDQRKARRPADGDGDGVEICDIGAMEVGADE